MMPDNECAACEFTEDCPNDHDLYRCQEVSPPQEKVAMHTPIPWTVARFEGNVEASGRVVANTMSYSCSGPGGESARQENIDNAAFIVRACNSHAALVQALKGLVDILSEQGWDGQSATDAHDKAIALLDKYKGES